MVLHFFELGIPDVIQIGGNQTIGKGIVRIQILKQEDKNDKGNNNN
jgi:CRISPR-associated protein Cmr4